MIAERSDLPAARAACVAALGEESTAQAAAVVASFDAINRVADATGIRVDPEIYARGGTRIVEDLSLAAIRGDRG